MSTARPFSFWETAAAIQSRPARNLPEQTDVLIVGAGFAGSWLAYFLKRAKPSRTITIIERDDFSLGASARNAGFLSCGNLSEWLEDVKDLGWEEARRTFDARLGGIETLLAELGDEIPLERCGSVDFDPVTDEKRELAEKLNKFLLERGNAPFFSERLVRLGRAGQPAFVNEFDSAVDPCQILQALHRKLESAGVTLITGEVTALADGRAEVGGRTIRYERGFLCTNGFSAKLHPRTTIRPARGQVIVTSPLKTETHRCLGFLRAGYDYFRFIGNRVLVGGGRLEFREAENTDSLAVTPELRSYLEAFAARVIGHRDFTVEAHWAGIMGLRAGRHASLSEFQVPVMIDSRTEEFSSCGGWGVTLTPYLARLKASAQT